MTTKSIYDGITHVVQLSTHIGSNCEHCNIRVGLDDFANSINHYITQHGYKLLHIGTQTGEALQMTVALLGR